MTVCVCILWCISIANSVANNHKDASIHTGAWVWTTMVYHRYKGFSINKANRFGKKTRPVQSPNNKRHRHATTSFTVVEDEGANTRRVGPYSALAWSEVIAHVCEVSAEHNQVQRSAFLCVGALISLSAPHYVSERSTYPCFPRAGLHFHDPAAVPLWTALGPHPDILAVLWQSFCQLRPE